MRLQTQILSGVFLLMVFLAGCSSEKPSPAAPNPAPLPPSPVNPNTQVTDASVAIKLLNKIKERDSNIGTIFDDPANEANFAQEIIQQSNMRKTFSNILSYGSQESDYLIEIVSLRMFNPQTLNRVFHEKSYVLDFRLLFQRHAAEGRGGPPLKTFVVSQIPLKIPFRGSMEDVYIRGLNEFLATTRANRYYKSAERIKNEATSGTQLTGAPLAAPRQDNENKSK